MSSVLLDWPTFDGYQAKKFRSICLRMLLLVLFRAPKGVGEMAYLCASNSLLALKLTGVFFTGKLNLLLLV